MIKSTNLKIILAISLILIVWFIAFLVGNTLYKSKYNKYVGMVVLDIDNTILCRGALAGNEKCGNGSLQLGPPQHNYYLKDGKKVFWSNTCGGATPDPGDPTQKSWEGMGTVPAFIHQQSYSVDEFGKPTGDLHTPAQGMGPALEARCTKPTDGDGLDINSLQCSLKTGTPVELPLTGCDPGLTYYPDSNNMLGTKGVVFPKGVDCGTKSRAIRLIKLCRKNNFAIAINTARFEADVLKQNSYLKDIGFLDDELKPFEKGGVITYNASQGYDLFTQAKQKAINLLALSERYKLPKNRIVLVDDMLINCKSVRGMGFKAYNCSTTMGQTFGWSQDHLDDWKSPDNNKNNPNVQCGITDSQIDKIIDLVTE